MTHFTPLIPTTSPDYELFKSFNRKISALERSLSHLTAISVLSTSQEERLRIVKKDLSVFRGKRTKLSNQYRPF